MTFGDRSLPKIYLRPEELLIAEEPVIITTVLGSCISAILYSPRLRVGAICHATMPSGKEKDPSKYADQSILYMLNHFRQLGIQQNKTIVKLFGGADMFTQNQPGGNDKTVGAQNAQVAIATLNQAGYKPMVVDVGGVRGRKLIFHSHTGDVFRKWVKRNS